MNVAPVNHPFEVDLQVDAGDTELPGGAEWSRWAVATLTAANHSSAARMTVRLVGFDESRRLNNTYRHTDNATNVLAFPGAQMSTLIYDEERELGDLVICLPMVHGEAQQQCKQPLAHMAHLFIHGTLHLIGFDHQDDVSAEQMERLETQIMRRLDFPDPYIVNQAIYGANDGE